MNYAIILAGGTGQRMGNAATPKQFLLVNGKPIIIYTLEVFQKNPNIDKIIIPCNGAWIDHMKSLIDKYGITKATNVIQGGKDRTGSILNGMDAIKEVLKPDDVLIIHDGVRPLVKEETIDGNIALVKEKGNAMTVRANIETVVVTQTGSATIDEFTNRDHTYTLTAPQSFRAGELLEVLKRIDELNAQENTVPILDVSLAYATLGKEVYLYVEKGNNLKITTPEDYCVFKAFVELEESKKILGI
ncbi:MAG: 2-C-methyl-D-erythritol 4-phosphate cytidylyltransferase [Clostridia bacterium]|nr:2-C-methyl-D-erythritol 4-phosphate cytidylyltransferase [Clostridia bacterium]